jgi:hypothetical protein
MSAPLANQARHLSQALAEAEALKRTPIPPGHVRFERNDYHYGRQGQVTRVGHVTKDLPESEAINWIAYGCSSVTWPDGAIETFDMRVSPVEHSFHRGYGRITLASGEQITGSLSRLNVLVSYYGVRLITEAERDGFELTHDTWGAMGNGGARSRARSRSRKRAISSTTRLLPRSGSPAAGWSGPGSSRGTGFRWS